MHDNELDAEVLSAEVPGAITPDAYTPFPRMPEDKVPKPKALHPKVPDTVKRESEVPDRRVPNHEVLESKVPDVNEPCTNKKCANDWEPSSQHLRRIYQQSNHHEAQCQGPTTKPTSPPLPMVEDTDSERRLLQCNQICFPVPCHSPPRGRRIRTVSVGGRGKTMVRFYLSFAIPLPPAGCCVFPTTPFFSSLALAHAEEQRSAPLRVSSPPPWQVISTASGGRHGATTMRFTLASPHLPIQYNLEN